jgi:hypothetical protein
MAVGILGYGSIANDPGSELAAAVADRIDVETPFAVEFARSSRTRDGAPTLVPVSQGGSSVRAVALVLEDSIGEADARVLLYRRETERSSRVVTPESAVWIVRLRGFAGLDTCLYTALKANIEPLTAERLAELAVRSAAAPAGAARRDGITYLAGQRRRGVLTPLMSAYEAQILALTGGRDLGDAWRRARAAPRQPDSTARRVCARVDKGGASGDDGAA